MSWSRWLQVREINYQTMTSGCSFRALAFGGSFFGRRVDESFYFLPSLGWWAPAAILVLAAMILGRCRSYWPSACRALLWIALTLVLWGALMFIPGSTFNHQGTFACQLVVMLALGSALWRLWRFGFWLVAALQVIAFVRVWIPPTPAAEARIFQLGPMFILALSLAVLLWLFHLAGGPEPGDR